MEERKGPDPVPFIVHEADLARMERTNTRLTIIACMLAAAIVITNAAWLILA